METGLNTTDLTEADSSSNNSILLQSWKEAIKFFLEGVAYTPIAIVGLFGKSQKVSAAIESNTICFRTTAGVKYRRVQCGNE